MNYRQSKKQVILIDDQILSGTLILDQIKLNQNDIIILQQFNYVKVLINGYQIIKCLNSLCKNDVQIILISKSKKSQSFKLITTLKDYAIYRKIEFPIIKNLIFYKADQESQEIFYLSSGSMINVISHRECCLQIILQKLVNCQRNNKNFNILVKEEIKQKIQAEYNITIIKQNLQNTLNILLNKINQNTIIQNWLNIFVDLQVETCNSRPQQTFIKSIRQFLLSKQNVLVVKGNSGCGKTHSIRHFFQNYSSQITFFKSVILFINLPSQNLQGISKKIDKHTDIVIIDNHNKNMIDIQKLIGRISEISDAKIVICSSDSFNKNCDLNQINIKPLSDKLIDSIIQKYEKNNQKSEKLMKFVKQDQIIQLSRNNLHLKMILKLLIQNGVYNRFDIFQKIILQSIKYNHIKNIDTYQIINYLGELSFIIYIKQSITPSQFQKYSKIIPNLQLFLNQHTLDHFSFRSKYLLQYCVVVYVVNQIIQNRLTFQVPQIIKSQSIFPIIKYYLTKNIQFKQTLMKLIISTKIDKSFEKNAAVAITLLNIAGVNFSGMDLSQISIPNADLTCGYFQQTNFQNSNLQNVAFNNSFCLKAKFNNANMTNVNFRIKPDLTLQSAVLCVVIDQIGKFIVASSQNKQIKVFQFSTLRLLLSWKIEFESRQLKISPDSKIIVTEDQHYINIWHSKSGLKLKTLQTFNNRVYSLCFSRDSNFIVSGGQDFTIKIWNIEQGVNVKVLAGHTDIINQICFSSTYHQVISCSKDKTIKIWNYETGETIKNISGEKKKISSICYSPNQDKIFYVSGDNTIKIFDINLDSIVGTLIGHDGHIYSIQCSPDGKKLASSSQDKSIIIWDTRTSHQLTKIENHHGYVYAICWTPDSKKIISGSYDNNIKIFDLDCRYIKQRIQVHKKQVNSIAISKKGDKIATGGEDCKIRIFNTESLEVQDIFEDENNKIYSLCFSPCDTKLASSHEHLIIIWDLVKKKIMKRLHGPNGIIFSINYSFCGQKLVSGGFDNVVRIWDLNLGQFIGCQGHVNQILTTCYSISGKSIASGGKDKKIIIWNAQTGNKLKVLQGHNSWILSIAYSKSNNQLSSAGTNKLIKIWDLQSGTIIKILNGHLHWVSSICYSPNNKFIVSGSFDKTIKIWDLQSRKQLKTFQGHENLIQGLVYSPDGTKIYSVSKDKSLKIWKNPQLQNEKKSNYNLIKSIPQKDLCLKFIQFAGVKTQKQVIQLMEQQYIRN